MAAKILSFSKPQAKEIKTEPTEAYRRLMKRNRELEEIIQMMKKEQENNGKKALLLVLKYPEVAELHKKRK